MLSQVNLSTGGRGLELRGPGTEKMKKKYAKRAASGALNRQRQ